MVTEANHDEIQGNRESPAARYLKIRVKVNIFHIIGYWYLAITLISIALIGTYALVEFAGRTLWVKMTRLRDVYVLNWWISALKESGFTVPTKSNMAELRRRMENIDRL